MRSRLRARLAAPVALAGLVATAGPAAAGWDNVFQVTCNDCQRAPARSYYAPRAPAVAYYDPAPAAQACPPKVQYQQRSFYEPITVMKPETYLEPVQVRSRSYFWEPVTSYSYSSYYDPCTCQCQQIATPRTSYRLKEQCNTTTRYLERTRMVPHQSQRLVTETVPVYTYTGPATRSYAAPQDNCELPPAGGGPAPRVDEQRSAPPTIAPSTDGGTIPPTQLPTTPGTAFPRSSPPAVRGFPARVNAHTTARAAGAVRGEVVRPDQVTPRAGAKLVFVRADDLSVREYATADAFGGFDVRLPAGDWYVYLGSGDGRATFHKKISVGEYDAKEFKVVSR